MNGCYKCYVGETPFVMIECDARYGDERAPIEFKVLEADQIAFRELHESIRNADAAITDTIG